MSAKTRNVRDYLTELEMSKESRTEQVRVGLELYIDLWKRSIERGVVGEGDEVGEALEKIEEAGGLYKAAGD